MRIVKIASKGNEKIKFLKKLGQKKYRDEYSQFLVENLKTIKGAIEAGSAPLSLFAAEKFINKNKNEFENLLSKIKPAEYFIISEQINKSFSNLDSPSGICAVFKKIKKKIDFKKPIIYLNGINDPGNLGTILRSASAFGISNIIIDEHCADIYNPKTINAGKDSVFWLNIEEDKNLKLLKNINKKMPIVSTRMDKADDVDFLKKQKNFCLVFGSEAHGISKDIMGLSTDFVTIQINPQAESLNVAIAASIFFYELFKK